MSANKEVGHRSATGCPTVRCRPLCPPTRLPIQPAGPARPLTARRICLLLHLAAGLKASATGKRGLAASCAGTMLPHSSCSCEVEVGDCELWWQRQNVVVMGSLSAQPAHLEGCHAPPSWQAPSRKSPTSSLGPPSFRAVPAALPSALQPAGFSARAAATARSFSLPPLGAWACPEYPGDTRHNGKPTLPSPLACCCMSAPPLCKGGTPQPVRPACAAAQSAPRVMGIAEQPRLGSGGAAERRSLAALQPARRLLWCSFLGGGRSVRVDRVLDKRFMKSCLTEQQCLTVR